jgi:hypothetical protein
MKSEKTATDSKQTSRKLSACLPKMAVGAQLLGWFPATV